MPRVSKSNTGRPIRWQRMLAALLALMMVSDLGFHLLDSFFHSSEGEAGYVLLASRELSLPPEGCGLPGHEGPACHHHHFPTLISSSVAPTPPLAWAWSWLVASPEVGRNSIILPQGRAPPVHF